MDYMSTDSGDDSWSRFPSRAQTDRQTRLTALPHGGGYTAEELYWENTEDDDDNTAYVCHLNMKDMEALNRRVYDIDMRLKV